MPKLNSDRRKLVVEEVPQINEIKSEPEVIVNEPEVSVTVETSFKEEQPEVIVPTPVVQAPVPQPISETPQYQTPDSDSISNGPNPAYIIVPGILLLGALLGGIVFYQKSVNNSSNNLASTETTTPAASSVATTAPTDAPKTEIDKKAHKVAVQNGSGVKGEASKVETLLEDDGFEVSSTGNADTYDYVETVIKAKSAVSSDFTAAISTALSETYKVATKVQTLSSSSTDEVVVIVGTSKN